MCFMASNSVQKRWKEQGSETRNNKTDLNSKWLIIIIQTEWWLINPRLKAVKTGIIQNVINGIIFGGS